MGLSGVPDPLTSFETALVTIFAGSMYGVKNVSIPYRKVGDRSSASHRASGSGASTQYRRSTSCHPTYLQNIITLFTSGGSNPKEARLDWVNGTEYGLRVSANSTNGT